MHLTCEKTCVQMKPSLFQPTPANKTHKGIKHKDMIWWLTVNIMAHVKCQSI